MSSKKCQKRNKRSSSLSKTGDRLIEAAAGGRVEVLKDLLEKFGGVHYQDGNGMDALMHACTKNELGAVKLLLSHQADPTHTDGNGYHSLTHAVTNHSVRCVSHLLTHAVTSNSFRNIVNIQDLKGHSPMHHAVRLRYKEVIHILLQEHSLDLFLAAHGTRGGVIAYAHTFWDQEGTDKEDKRTTPIKDITFMLIDEIHKKKELTKLWSLMSDSCMGENDKWISDLFEAVPGTALLQEISETEELDLIREISKEITARMARSQYPLQLSPIDISILLDIALERDMACYRTLKNTCAILEAVICPLEWSEGADTVLRGAPSSTTGAARMMTQHEKRKPFKPTIAPKDDGLDTLLSVWRIAHEGTVRLTLLRPHVADSRLSEEIGIITDEYKVLFSMLSEQTRLGTRLLKVQEVAVEDVWQDSIEKVMKMHERVVDAFLRITEDVFTANGSVKERVMETMQCVLSVESISTTPQLSKDFMCIVLVSVLELLQKDGMCLLHHLRHMDDGHLPERFLLLSCTAIWMLSQLGRELVVQHEDLQRGLASLDLVWSTFKTCTGYLADPNQVPEDYDRFSVLLFCMFYWMQTSLVFRSTCPLRDACVSGGANLLIPVKIEGGIHPSHSTPTTGPTPPPRAIINQLHYASPLGELFSKPLSIEIDEVSGFLTQQEQWGVCDEVRPSIIKNERTLPKSRASWTRGRPSAEEPRFRLLPVQMDVFSHIPVDEAGMEESMGMGVRFKWLTGWNTFRGCHEIVSLRSRNTTVWQARNPPPATLYEEHTVTSLTQTMVGTLQMLMCLPVHPEFLEFCMIRHHELNYSLLKGRLDGGSERSSTRGMRGLEVFIKHPQLQPLLTQSIKKGWVSSKVEHMGRQQHQLRDMYRGTGMDITPLHFVPKAGEQKPGKRLRRRRPRLDCDVELRGNILPTYEVIPLDNWGVVISQKLGFKCVEEDQRTASTSVGDSSSTSSEWTSFGSKWDDEKWTHDNPKPKYPRVDTETSSASNLQAGEWEATPIATPPSRAFRNSFQASPRRYGNLNFKGRPLNLSKAVSSVTRKLVYPKNAVATLSAEGDDDWQFPELWVVTADVVNPMFGPDQEGPACARHYRHEVIAGTLEEGMVKEDVSGYWYPVAVGGEEALCGVEKREEGPSFVLDDDEGPGVYFNLKEGPDCISYITGVGSWEAFRCYVASAYGYEGEADSVGVWTRDVLSSFRSSSPRLRVASGTEPFTLVANETWPPESSISRPLKVSFERMGMESDSASDADTDDSDDQCSCGDESSDLSLLPMSLNVDRADFYNSIANKILLKPISTKAIEVEFAREPGSGDGPNKEFFGLIAQELVFNPSHKQTLFVSALQGINRHALLFNRLEPTPEVLKIYATIGRLLGCALTSSYEVGGMELAKGYYKILLSHPLVLSDVQYIDIDVYHSLRWVVENDVEGLDLTFTHTVVKGEEVVEVDLVEGGSNVAVTNANKARFVELKVGAVHTAGVEPLLQALASGFWCEAPSLLCRYVFTADDLVAAFAGTADIDPDSWEAFTAYETLRTGSSSVVQWFWRYVREQTEEGRRKLLLFATGSSTLPVGGFRSLAENNDDGDYTGKAFTIEILSQGEDNNGHPVTGEKLQQLLPSAQTCFNTLLLPPYTSYEVLKERLDVAIHMGNKGYYEA